MYVALLVYTKRLQNILTHLLSCYYNIYTVNVSNLKAENYMPIFPRFNFSSPVRLTEFLSFLYLYSGGGGGRSRGGRRKLFLWHFSGDVLFLLSRSLSCSSVHFLMSCHSTNLRRKEKNILDAFLQLT